ncbi:MAG: GtrA family protein [Opitutales bacterium]|nr:GtrA family protein [Opitutales bacterium]
MEHFCRWVEYSLQTLWNRWFCFLRFSPIPQMPPVLLQFVRFSIIGSTTTLFSYTLYLLFLYWIRACYPFPLDYIVASILTFFLVMSWSFYWNLRLVFTQAKTKSYARWKSFGKTCLVYIFTGFVLTNLFLFLWVQIIGISEYLAPFLNLMITVPLNFIFNKHWAYR